MKLDVSSFVSGKSFRARISDIIIESREIGGKEVKSLVFVLEFRSGKLVRRRFRVSEHTESGFYEFLKALAKLGFVFRDTDNDDDAVFQLKQKLVGKAFRFVSKELEPVRGSTKSRRVDIPVEVLSDFSVSESGDDADEEVAGDALAVQSVTEPSQSVSQSAQVSSGSVSVVDKIKQALSGGKAMTLTELASATGVPYAELSKALMSMKEKGEIVQDTANGVKLRLK